MFLTVNVLHYDLSISELGGRKLPSIRVDATGYVTRSPARTGERNDLTMSTKSYPRIHPKAPLR